MSEKAYTGAVAALVRQKVSDYQMLTKFRLATLVVFSAGIAYCLGASKLDWLALVLLCFAGFLVTGASNALNQVLERDYDKLMQRTSNRPLAAGRMSVPEAVIAAGIMSVTGILLLTYCFNPIAGVFGALSLVSYAFIYTPMKRISPAAVWIGAFPGAFPMVIGWVAATGQFGIEAIVLFSIQFFWQFPHFWAIAWAAYDDYSKAGFYLLPTRERDGRNLQTALHCLTYALVLIPLGLMPYMLGISGLFSAIVAALLAAIYVLSTLRLVRNRDKRSARVVMFTSFFYLPIVLIAFLLDKS